MASSSSAVLPLAGADEVARAFRRRRPPPLLVGVAALIGVVFAAPLGYVLWQNLEAGSGFLDILGERRTWEPLGRSLLLATTVSASAAVVGTGLAWLIVRTDLPGRRVWRVLAPLPLVFPSFVGAAALISGFATGGLLERVAQPFGIGELPELAGFRAAWFVLTLFTYPYVYLPVAARLKRLPAAAEESARLLGRSPGSVFLSVVLPQTRTAISAGALLVFLYTVSDFGAVELLRYDTLTREIFANQLIDRPTAMALSLLLGIVALGVVAGERALIRRDPPAGRAAHSGMTVALGRWRWPSLAAVTAFLGFAIAGPVASLAHWTIRGIDSTRSTGALAVDVDGLGGAVTNTVLVSVTTAAVTVAVVLPIAYLTIRHRSTVGGVANGLVVGGAPLPGLVGPALAFVFWVLSSDALVALYQTLPLLVLAYVVHFGAQASRASQVAVSTVPPRLEDAARMLGANRRRRFLSIELPIMAPGLLAAAGLVLLSTMKELPATLLLAPIGFDTVATRIWASMDNVSYAQAGLDSMVLLAVSAVLTWLLVIRTADHLD